MAHHWPLIYFVGGDPATHTPYAEALHASLPAVALAWFADPAHACSSQAQPPPDVIVLDLTLPTPAPGELPGRLSTHFAGTPLLVLIPFDCEQELADILAAGADDFLLKTPQVHLHLHHRIMSILEHRALQKRLLASERRYQAFFDRVPVGLFHAALDGELRTVNPVLGDILGVKELSSLRGRNIVDFFTAPESVAHWRRQEESQVEQSFSALQIGRDDGTVRWVRLGAGIVWDATTGHPGYEGYLQEISEQHRAQEALRTSEEKLRLIFEHAFDGISIYEELPEQGGRQLLECNERYADIAGFSREELMEIGNTSLVQRKVGRVFSRAENLFIRQNKVPYRGFFSWQRPDGKDNVIEYSAAPIDVGGRPLTIGIDRDITEQIRAQEEALRRAAHLEALNAVIGAATTAGTIPGLMRATVQHLTASLIADEVVLWVGEETAATHGTAASATELRTQFHRAITTTAHLIDAPPTDEQAARATWLAAPILHEGSILGGFVVRAADVEAWPADATALADAIGRTVGAAIVRLQLLEQIQTQARQLEALLEVAPAGILLLDETHRIIHMNPAARTALTRLGAPEQPIPVVGAPLSSFGGLTIATLLAATGDGPASEIELENGAQLYAVSARPVLTQDKTQGSLIVVRNITEARDRQQRSEQQGRLAAVGQLASGIAHDFNNILAVMLLLAQLVLQEKHLSAKGRQRMQTLIDQAHHASDLIRQILDFSRRSVQKRSVGDLGELLTETAQLLRRTLPVNIQVTTEIGAQEFTLEADFTQIKQILMNLALNAQHAMPAGGALALRLERIHVAAGVRQTPPGVQPGDWYKLTVADTGHGIPSAVLPHIFEPFFTTKEVGKGTGLGLAQVYGIVKQHGGEITVESRERTGTRFTIYLPASEQARRMEFSAATTSPTLPPRPTLLYIEDDELLRNTICEVVEMSGFTVLAAASGEDALARHADRLTEIDLVISDLALRGMSGIELHRALRLRLPTVRTLILSAHPMNLEQSIAHEAGIAGWVQKPISMVDLVAQIRHALTPAEEEGYRRQ